MTKLLERAIAEVKKLPVMQQDAIATLILEELQDEVYWDEAFEKSQRVLASLAEEAMDEDRAGRTWQLDPDNM